MEDLLSPVLARTFHEQTHLDSGGCLSGIPYISPPQEAGKPGGRSTCSWEPGSHQGPACSLGLTNSYEWYSQGDRTIYHG